MVNTAKVTTSVCKSGLKTDPRPRPDRKKTGKDRTGGPGLSLSKQKDRKKTGLEGPVHLGSDWSLVVL